MIGITMPSGTFYNEMKHYNVQDSILNQYKPLAKKYKVDLCLFGFHRIDPTLKTGEALLYSWKNDRVTWRNTMLPRVNIVRNTSYVSNQNLINKFESLRRQKIHFINLPVYWQANKLKNYEYLSSLKRFKDHVPPTKRLTFEHLDGFVRQYGKVIIKPIFGSKGRGITIIEKDGSQYRVQQTATRLRTFGRSRKTLCIPETQIHRFYHETFHRPQAFLVQQWIPFQESNGRPFDIRAVVQKNGRNKWQVTSRVARVASKQGQITNLSQGGEMVSLSTLLQKNDKREIRDFCLGIAKSFEKLYPWSAEMGIDLAIDKDGKLWYIETNYCPEKEKWSTIFKVPFEFAYYLYSK